MPASRARFWLRFTVLKVQKLAELLQIDQVEYRERIQVDPTTALAVVCARLSYPSRLSQVSDLFGRSATWLSIVFNDTCIFLSNRFRQRLQWHPQLNQYERLLRFAEPVEGIGGVSGI